MKDLKIVGWTDFECGFPTPKWEKDEMNKVIDLICDEISKNNYIFSGQEHQNSITGVPVLSDGTCFRASMRCWGSIMAQVYGDPNGETLPYMDFYMRGDCPSNLPDFEEVDINPAVIQEKSFGCVLKVDRQMIEEALDLGMPFLTTDKVLNDRYDDELKKRGNKE